jgi:hypothetical protein
MSTQIHHVLVFAQPYTMRYVRVAVAP